MRGEVAKDPFDEGSAGDGGHGLGDFAKEVAHAGALTAREQKGGDIWLRRHGFKRWSIGRSG